MLHSVKFPASRLTLLLLLASVVSVPAGPQD